MRNNTVVVEGSISCIMSLNAINVQFPKKYQIISIRICCKILEVIIAPAKRSQYIF
jgi:hypothetical protein